MLGTPSNGLSKIKIILHACVGYPTRANVSTSLRNSCWFLFLPLLSACAIVSPGGYGRSNDGTDFGRCVWAVKQQAGSGDMHF